MVDGGAGVTTEAVVPGVATTALGDDDGLVIGGGLEAWCVCLEGPHDKPFGVWVGDDVQPAKCRSESI